jgi:hypothetical protein
MQLGRHTFRSLAFAAAVAAGCAGAASPPSSPAIHLDTTDRRQAVVEVGGISRRDLSALAMLELTEGEWAEMLRVTVSSPDHSGGASLPAVAGRYAVGGSIRFTPSFPLDPGRRYEVSFDTSRLVRAGVPLMPAAQAVVGLPALTRTSTTVVTAVYPSGGVIPENQLRMYVHFSGPMGQQGGLDHIVLVDREGREIPDALLPLDTELWNGDRTRYTVLFDPGRVKREILPNRSMGRPLAAGETITLIVKADWPDATGAPLKAEFRREYQVGPEDEKPLNTTAWRIAAPSAGTREALIVTFPEPLDHALLQRALAVARDGTAVPGQLEVAAGETRWSFVPRDPWQTGPHALVVLPILEDLAGNRMGRAFEVRSPGDAVPAEDARPTSIPFQVPPTSAR